MRNRQRVEKTAGTLFVLCICFCKVAWGGEGSGTDGSVVSACELSGSFYIHCC